MWRQHLILCLTIAACWAVPKTDRKRELQRLVRLPQIAFSSPLEFDRVSGFNVFPLAGSAGAEVTQILAEAKGTATDAALHLRAARLYAGTRDVANAIRSYARAADLFGRQVSADGGNGAALLGLADALGGLGRLSEAEAVLSKAESSGAADTALALARARFHQEKAWTEFAGEETRFSGQSFLEIVRALVAHDSGANIENTRRELKAAREEYARVADREQKNAAFFQQRATFFSFSAVLECAFQQIQQDEGTPDDLHRSLFAAEARIDLNRAAELENDDPALVATALFADALGSIGEQEASDVWTQLTSEAREQLVRNCRMLQEIAASGTKDAAAAAEYLGCAQVFLMKDYAGAERSFRKALAVEPARERSWDLLIFSVYSGGNGARLVETSEHRATTVPSARSSAILIKSYDRQGDALRAELAALLASGSYPHDFSVHLSLAALLLKREELDGVLSRAGDALNRAEKQMGAARPESQQLEFVLLKSIYLGLSGDSERAKTLLRPFISPGRTSPEVQAVLQALD